MQSIRACALSRELRQSNVAPWGCNTVVLPKNTRSNGFLGWRPAEPLCFEYRLVFMAGWFIITRHNFPQDSLSINQGTIPAWLSDGIREQVQKERIRLPSCTGSWDRSSHMHNRHKQDREWECAARQSSRQRNWVTAVKEKKQERVLNTVYVGKGGLWGHVLYISHAHCVSVLILPLSMTVVWELLKVDRSGWRARLASLQGALREMCWALSQRGVHTLSGEDLHCKS